jgi:hypothetical protein
MALPAFLVPGQFGGAGTKMNELEQEFDNAVMNAVNEGARLGYSASYYLRKRAEDGPMFTALRLLKDKQLSYGLRQLRSMRRLDLSLEAIVYSSAKFQALFGQAVVDRCKEKLTALGYFEKTRVFPPLPKVDWYGR